MHGRKRHLNRTNHLSAPHRNHFDFPRGPPYDGDILHHADCLLGIALSGSMGKSWIDSQTYFTPSISPSPKKILA
jgi:hypothetical protein